MSDPVARLMAGVPALNAALYHQVRFLVGDPAALVEIPSAGGAERTLIVRDIELDRARQTARANHVACPASFPPPGGLSGDRETATAQAAAELLVRSGARRVVVDRSLPMLFAEQLRQRGLETVFDPDWGVAERRAKDEQEIAWLRQAQHDTEDALEMACRTVARAERDRAGQLLHEGKPLTSERLRGMIDVWLLERGYLNPRAIVSGGPAGADCHDAGCGPLFTGQPIIIDVFPRNRQTLYNGDCTRTVVHGEIPPVVAAMHRAVLEAKQAAIAATRAGVSGEAVHQAAIDVIRAAGYHSGLPGPDDPPEWTSMVHGTGHGVGLEVHEPPLLDRAGPPLVAGDVLTIEPGLYCRAVGGVRVEDMVVVRALGAENLNRLPEGLDWR